MHRLGGLDSCIVICLVGGLVECYVWQPDDSVTTLTGCARNTKQALLHSTHGGENGIATVGISISVSAHGSETGVHEKVSYAYMTLIFILVHWANLIWFKCSMWLTHDERFLPGKSSHLLEKESNILS